MLKIYNIFMGNTEVEKAIIQYVKELEYYLEKLDDRICELEQRQLLKDEDYKVINRMYNMIYERKI